jgi:hypothetical protein
MKNHKDLLTENEQGHLYLIHHMHHLESGKSAKHELHHCFLFSEKNMKGDKYQIKHSVLDGKLFHILDKNFSGKIFDHANRAFNIAVKKINGKNYSVVQ